MPGACCMPTFPATRNCPVRASSTWRRATRPELEIFVAHSLPCSLTVTIENSDGETVKTLAAAAGTRPESLVPEGSLFYWNGTLRDGSDAPAGNYSIRITCALLAVKRTKQSAQSRWNERIGRARSRRKKIECHPWANRFKTCQEQRRPWLPLLTGATALFRRSRPEILSFWCRLIPKASSSRFP